MSIKNKLFKDKDGNVVVGQAPNLWLYGWLGFKLISLVTHDRLSESFGLLSTLSLAVWAVLEIGWGVNYFRRLLGLLIGAFTLASLIMQIRTF